MDTGLVLCPVTDLLLALFSLLPFFLLIVPVGGETLYGSHTHVQHSLGLHGLPVVFEGMRELRKHMNSLPPDDKSCDAEEKENATHYTLPFIVRLIQLCVRLVEFYPIK